MKWAVLAVALFIVAGCSNEPRTDPGPNNPDQPATVNPEPEDQESALKDAEVIATNLKVPWDMIKRDEGFYISLRGGKIVNLSRDGEVSPMPLQLEKEITQNGEGGLLGFVLAPDFEETSKAYIYHTYKQNGQTHNRIVKVKKADNTWREQNVLLDGIPGSSIHNGGRLEIGPDGKLYVTVGDAGNPENAQDLDSLSGKILRMNLDGSIPSDNPFPDSYVYSYGHRNPQGLAWSKDGTLYSAEHGLSAHDEINLIRPGKNYGWPVIQGDETKEDMESPLFHSGENTWAPSGLAYHDGKLYVAGLAGEQIRVFHLADYKTGIVFNNVGRIRDILIEEGSMYVITNNTDGRGNPGPNDDKLLLIRLTRT